MIMRAKQPWTQLEKDTWAMPPEVTVSHWADKNRIVVGGAEPGPWRTERVPYSKGIMDAYGEPVVEEITIVGPAQCSKTEDVFNMIGYTVDVDPVESAYVIARDEDCEDISNDRLGPMFEKSPALARHLTGRPWDMKIGRVFRFDRMPLYFISAQSAPALASKPIGRIFFDETDKYKELIGKAGSPVKLGKRRTTTFGDVKIVYLCTPTTKDGFIYQSYQLSNMQTYHVPCPHCGGRYQRLKFGRLKVDPPDLRDPEVIIENECVYYECEYCEGKIKEHYKMDMLANGLWVPAGCRVDKNGRLTGKPLRGRRHCGFWIDGLLSPWLLWHRVLAEWFEVTKDEVSPAVLREFKNQVLAEVWEEIGMKVDVTQLRSHKGQFSRGTVPDDCLILVAGADYHEDMRGMVRIDYEVRGFGYGLKNQVISSGSVGSFEELEDEVLLSPFPWADPIGVNKNKPELAVVQLFIDSRYKPDVVYDFCLQYPGLAIPTKGVQHQRAPLVAAKLDRVSYERRKRYKGMQQLLIDTEFFKDRVTTWAKRTPGERGATEFYDEIPERYFLDFCNEVKVKTRDKYGRVSWHWQPVSKGAPTHHLDTAVLAAAAAYYKKAHIRFGRHPGKKRKRAAARKKKIRLSEKQRRRR